MGLRSQKIGAWQESHSCSSSVYLDDFFRLHARGGSKALNLQMDRRPKTLHHHIQTLYIASVRMKPAVTYGCDKPIVLICNQLSLGVFGSSYWCHPLHIPSLWPFFQSQTLVHIRCPLLPLCDSPTPCSTLTTNQWWREIVSFWVEEQHHCYYQTHQCHNQMLQVGC